MPATRNDNATSAENGFGSQTTMGTSVKVANVKLRGADRRPSRMLG